MIPEEDRRELERIATSLTARRASVARRDSVGLDRMVTLAEDDPALQPDHESFDLSKWLQNVIRQLSAEGISLKRSGVCYRDLVVSGTAPALQLQETLGSVLTAPLRIGEMFSFGSCEPKRILHGFDGILKGGELLVVLGRPGSGCSTLLKTICGQLHGLTVDDKSTIHYDGIPQNIMMKEFKGETPYNQEVDKHFPHLTVGQTLEFAAQVRTPSKRPGQATRKEVSSLAAKVVMAVCGLSHTYNTKVGNDFVRGVSGGERKRVSIAEMILAGSPLAAWDNSTRGLDSATALKFVQSLRLGSDLCQSANAVAIYQASQSIYDLFDKATVLYEGRQIYFGSAKAAKSYFERQGWECPARQTTGDFLTSVTNPSERVARPGMENQVPRTPEEFERRWKQSEEYKLLQNEIQQYEIEFPVDPQGGGDSLAVLRQQKNERQAKHVRPESPYTISILMQIRLNTIRAYQRLWGDRSAVLTTFISQVIISLIIGSVFYGTPDASAGFYSKGSAIFIAVLVNGLTSISEISTLYSQRPIVEKHASYAFYHPATEAIAGIVADIPIKFVMATIFNIIFYFMVGLRREPAQFFLFFLITYMCTFAMSAIFRTMAAITKTEAQAMSLAGVLILALVIYTGFVISVPLMHPWFSWIRWLNPLYYGFEILVANEFHGRNFTCSSVIPSYTPQYGTSWVCSIAGAIAGQSTVNGDQFIATNYRYYYSHVWRNFGIIMAFLVFFFAIYFIAVELNSSTTSTAEALVYQRGHVPVHLKKGTKQPFSDAEMVEATHAKPQADQSDMKVIQPQKDIFTWQDVVYDIEIKGQPRRLLDNVSGWVKPGTLTALMGVSGAGKTTLLDVLAQRTSIGVITGGMFVNGKPLDAGFQRSAGYVQQQDLHLQTATVRESLRFSALLRQPKSVTKQQKYAYVEEVIKLLNMTEFADAIVGVPGEGLNVEQRKLLTIGVELAAKPKLLLFLDEPTSGLDSQSSWAICSFLRKLADAGQAVLCTVHQPSALLFQQFDRLLFLAQGGKTVYFGNIGPQSRTLLDYFEYNGARACDDQENPAEYMLEIVNETHDRQGRAWFETWRESAESAAVNAEIARIHEAKRSEPVIRDTGDASNTEFAASFWYQLWVVTVRVFQQYWRTPSYIVAKWFLAIAAGLFIGFSFFKANTSLAGMQTIQFASFMLITIFSTVVQQIQPVFVTQRSLYEVRERPSKSYSWYVFLIANVLVEIPYQIVMGILAFACFYYPVAGVQSSQRQGLVLLFCIQLFVYAASFAQMTVAALRDAATAGSIVTLLTMMSLTFCGVLQTPTSLPGFWIFMYRVSPFSYWVAGMISTQLHGRAVECTESETSIFDPPPGVSCGEYLEKYLAVASGYLQNPSDMLQCRYCSVTVADQYLAGSNIYYSQRWRNFGIVWAYIVFNVFISVLTYYLFRVHRWNSGSKKLKSGAKAQVSENEKQ
ncbi:ABC-2 type transporter-domain-containing protein [Xylariales sp. PMI_506]|nr:ABC-2 type transporter-domain-containing protein [Xylariales sp. PMI_506]